MTGGGAQPLRRPGGGLLWQQLPVDLRRRPADGEFADGFPGELAPVAGYDLSRRTVRQAVRQLRAEGVVAAGRGLAAPLLDVDFTRTALHAEYRHRCGVTLTGGQEHIHAIVPTAAFVVDRLALAPGDRRARTADGRPGTVV